MISTSSEQRLHIILEDGDPGPNITCSADGHLPPTVMWMREHGSQDVPSDVTQVFQGDSVVRLQWLRPVKFTDSGSYVCRASNNVGTGIAILEVLVQSKYNGRW